MVGVWWALSADEVPPPVGCAVPTATPAIPTPTASPACIVQLGAGSKPAAYKDPTWFFIATSDRKQPDVNLPQSFNLPIFERLHPRHLNNPEMDSASGALIVRVEYQAESYWFNSSVGVTLVSGNCDLLPANTPTPPPFATPTSSSLPWTKPTFEALPFGAVSLMEPSVFSSLFGAQGRGCRLFAYSSSAYGSTAGLHPGFDFYVPYKSIVYAVSDGIVAGLVPKPSVSGNGVVESFIPEDVVSKTRQAIIIRHGYTYVVYGHLGGIFVTVGQQVSAGQPIGWVGAYLEIPENGEPQSNFGPHLHLELRTFSQAQSYTDLVNLWGMVPNGVIDPEQTQIAFVPLLFVNPARYFTSWLGDMLNACVTNTHTSSFYTSFEGSTGRPNAGTTSLPTNQSINCFQFGTPVPFESCDGPPSGAPQN